MTDMHEPETEYQRRRQPKDSALFSENQVSSNAEAPVSHDNIPATRADLFRSTHLTASYNAPMRAAAIQRMQQTHGNVATHRASLRSVQRCVQRTPASPQQATPEQQRGGGWPWWLSNLPGPLRTLAMHVGNVPAPLSAPATTSAPGGSSAPGGGGPGVGGGRSPLDLLFPDLNEEEVDAAFRKASAPTGLELPGQNPHVVAPGQPANGRSIGLQGDPSELVVPEDVPRTGMRQNTVGEDPTKIAYHENMEFRDVGDPVLDSDGNQEMRPDRRPPLIDADGTPIPRPDVPKVSPAPHQRVQVRYHSANPNAPEGSYSHSNPTIQVNTDSAKFWQLPDGSYKRYNDITPAVRATATEAGNIPLYRLPDGKWKPIKHMTPDERAAAHYPAGDAVDPSPPSGVDAPPPIESGGGWRNAFRSGGAVDRTMRGASYGFQFLGNLSRGQDAGEALMGAAAGGYANNAIGNHLMSKSPKGGLVDMGINLVNSGLQLAGAPEEVTAVTQTVADATPSSFGTSLANNAGRGLWNLGDGIFNGDWSGMKQQGQDLVRGKEGAPLQGYGLMGLMATTDREEWGDITDDMAEGEYGFLPKLGVKGSRWLQETSGDVADWAKETASDAADTWKEASILATDGVAGLQRYKKMKASEGPRQAAWHEMNRKRIAAEKARHEEFEKQWNAIYSQDWSDPGQTSTMLGGAGDALSAKSIWGQTPQYDEDGEVIAPTPMALPPNLR